MEGKVEMKLQDVLDLIAEPERLKKEYEEKIKNITENLSIIERFLKEFLIDTSSIFGNIDRKIKIQDLLEIFLKKNNITITKLKL